MGSIDNWGRAGRESAAHRRKRFGVEGRGAKRSLAAATTLLLGAGLLPATLLAVVPAANAAGPVGQGFNVNPSDLKFILKQIKISEQHALTATASDPCSTLLGSGPDQIPNDNGAGTELPWGLRTVDGSCNNLKPGQKEFGQADQLFPRRTQPNFRTAEAAPTSPGFPPGNGNPTSYGQAGTVYDSQPRVISNLVVDQTDTNPAAVAAAGEGAVPDSSGTLFIPNTAPDVGLSAPYNTWFTYFGQFFDHGLDLVNKGGSGTVFVPLKADDPLFNTAPGAPNFMVMTRASGSPVDSRNQTATFVDQSQTYTSHPSHQVFLREYNTTGRPVSTGKMLTGPQGGMGTWASVKAQAATRLGIQLSDMDVLNVPLLATDAYGKFVPGPNGNPQIVVPSAPGGLVEGNRGAPVAVPANATKTGHAFLDDIAHNAGPAGKTADTDPDLNPVGPPRPAGRYDNELLEAHFVAGDGRVNENIALTTVHHVFHSEHNRLAGDATIPGSVKNVLTTEDVASITDWQTSPGVWNGERIFQAARFITEMQYQHLAFEEFVRKVQPQVNLFAGYDSDINPAIPAEFAHTVYRFGHSMLTETVDRLPAGAPGSQTEKMPLLDAFLNPDSFLKGGTLTPEQAAGGIVRGLTRQVGNELDEFTTDVLRNSLLGLPLDLPTLNIARGRDTGMPRLNQARRELFADTGDSILRPYDSWMDFGLGIRHPESLINFVAAYGQHPSILSVTTRAAKRTAAGRLVANDPLVTGTPTDSAAFMQGTGTWATGSGLEDVDFWVGGLAEKQAPFGGLLGSTFNYIFETSMEDMQDGDRFYYLSRTAGLNMLTQLEGNSFAELISRNTDASGLPADSFSRPDLVFNLSAQNPTGAIVDDPATEEYDERTLLIRQGTHIRYSGDKHVLWVGSAGGDDAWSSEGDDTLRGNELNDRLEGGAGNDGLIGGDGNDIMTDSFGDDVFKGGDGDDAMSSGQGFDLNQGGRGNDFVKSGSDPTETFGGAGNDFILGSDSFDTVFGDDGDDWIEGGGQSDLLQGDNGALFQDDLNTPGDDVIIGQGGADDYDSEGGNDVMVAGPGIERNEGMLGFDWTIHKDDPQAALDDLNFTGLLPDSLDAFRDRFDLTESLSGWKFDDSLKGDDLAVADYAGHELTGTKMDAVTGLRALLGSNATGSAVAFNSGNILLGGGGSDTIEGRGGDDVIDGDAWYNVRLSVRTNPLNPSTEIGSADLMGSQYLRDAAGALTGPSLQAAVFAGTVNPGNIVVVREILTTPGGTDAAVFSGRSDSYVCIVGTDAAALCPTTVPSGQTVTVIHDDAGVPGAGVDGTDTLRNIERLVFSDTVVPDAPVIRPATFGAGAQAGSVIVNWLAVNAGSAVTGYRVRVVNAANAQVGALLPAGAAATTRLVSGLTPGTAYRFQVQAFNAVGDSAFSALSAALTLPVPTVAGAPTIGTATAGNGSATARWTAPASDGNSPITGYQVQVLIAGTNTQVGAMRPAGAAATSLGVTELANGTSYRLRVRAVNAVGTGLLSAQSNAVTPATVPGRTVIGTATSGAVGGAVNATARWTPPASTGGSAITGYRVTALRMGANGAVLSRNTSPALAATTRSLVFTLPAGNYRFEVVALNAVGPGAASVRSNQVVAR